MRRFSRFCVAAMLWALASRASAALQDKQPAAETLRAVKIETDGDEQNAPNMRVPRCFDDQNWQASNEREKAAVENLPEHYRYWLEEDVAYLIAPEERCAYLHRESDEERDQFIDQFWVRRAPDPESLQNDFEDEHYRRIVYANENFSTKQPGRATDRGRVYVLYGPPDKIESHASSEPTGRPLEEGPATVEFRMKYGATDILRASVRTLSLNLWTQLQPAITD